jgi:hypothetical protein
VALKKAMITAKPLPFQQALDALTVKSPLPTSASSRALEQLPAQLARRATFSARTNSAWYVSRIADVTESLTAGLSRAQGGMSKPQAMQALRDALKQLGYHPGTAGIEPRSIQDFSSDRRLKLIVDTNVDLAQGYGHHTAGQDPVILDAFPCQELVREINSRVKRPWTSIWERAGGRIYAGRMIALKNDPVWTRISRFNLPYPPFDFNSGMGVRDISRREARDLGVAGIEQPQAPAPMSLNSDLAASPPQRHRDLLAALRDQLGDLVTIDPDGTIHLREAAA